VIIIAADLAFCLKYIFITQRFTVRVICSFYRLICVSIHVFMPLCTLSRLSAVRGTPSE